MSINDPKTLILVAFASCLATLATLRFSDAALALIGVDGRRKRDDDDDEFDDDDDDAADEAEAAALGERSAPRNRATSVCENGVLDLIGDTPLLHLPTLSRACGRRILAKVEFANPGGSTKDRVCRAIIAEAERSGALRPGGTVYEGTVGSTGISLACVARARGFNAHVVMPDDQATEKAQWLRVYGASVEQVRPLSIVDSAQYGL